ncbi:MAG: alginate export family protein [Acidobacteriota bacterium]
MNQAVMIFNKALRLLTTILMCLVLSAQARMAFAQDNSAASNNSSSSSKPDAPAEKKSTSPAQIKIGSLIVSGSLRVRVENWDFFDTKAANDNYTFAAMLLRLSIGQQKVRFDWQVEGAFPSLINLPDNAIAPAPQGQLGLGATYFAANQRQDASAILKQAFVRWKGISGDKPSSLRIGRFEFADGSEVIPADPTLATLKRDHIAHRLIGPFTFSHVGRSFDGVHYARNTKAFNLTFLGARPTEGVFQLRSLKELDVDLFYGALTKPFKGKSSESEARFFTLHYHDGRGAVKTDNRPLSARIADTENIRLTTLGGHYIGVYKAGESKVDLLVWGAGQVGDWGNLSHQAGAIAVEAGFQPGKFATRIKPWIRTGYFRSSGDGNPSDNNHTTFFQILPTPRIYARFPIYNLMNNQDVFAQLRLNPHSRLSLRTDVRYLRLSNERDLYYQGGGAFQKGTFGYVGRPSGGKKSLGTLIDLSADYNITSRTGLTFYIGGLKGSSVASSIYPRSNSAHLAYFELTQRF